ncbi:MAG: LamG domain-containing protein [Armatimonadetes bacterium]|nr:LamG domain-containing protein [Armatimonadota bacterium]
MLTLLLHLLLAAPQGGPLVTLAVPLDTSIDAVTSAGIATGTAHHDPVGGAAWALRGGRDVLGWSARGNVGKARGTLSLRLKPAWSADDVTWRAIVCDDRPMDPKTENGFRLWKYERSIRFDLRSPEDRYVTFPADALTPGAWHQITVTWDAEVGTRVYLDGRKRGSADYQFTPTESRWLFLGGPDWQPALGDYRDLVVFDRMLSDEQVAQLATGTLTRTPAPRAAVVPPPPAPTVDTTPAKPVFHASLIGDLQADLAANGAAPRRTDKVTFVDSPFGKAAHFGPGAVLEYPGGANLPHDRGAISVWVRPDWSTADAPADRYFVREPEPEAVGGDARWMWFWSNSRQLRFDVRDPADANISASADAWEAGSWHHLVLSWDVTRGEHEAFVDGRSMRPMSDAGNLFGEGRGWTPKPRPFFWVGSWGGNAPAMAAMADLTIYDRALRPADVAAAYARLAPVVAATAQPYFAPGTRALVVQVTNGSAAPVRDLRARIAHDGRADEVALAGVTLAAGETRTVTVPLRESQPGAYLVSVAPADRVPGPSAFCYLRETPPPVVTTAPGEKLVQSIDLTAALGDELLADDGASRVVESAAGRYREAGTKRGSRFAVRLRLANLGAWHRLEWVWPDDRPRTVDVILNRSQYDVATGTLSGDEYPTTGAMRTQSAYFWPRAADDAAVFMTAEAGRPAAVASLKVYELSGPPAALQAPKPRFRGAEPRRVGLYYEDPVLHMNLGGEPSFPSFAAVADRLVAYMEATGLNTLYYPAVWYHGPLFPTASQGPGTHSGRPHPQDFLRYLLSRFEGRGLKLLVTFNVHDVPSLAGAESNEDRVRAGAATPVTVQWNAGLKTTGWHGTASNYNPLDPQVHGALRGLVTELASRYADSPAFGGLCLHLPVHSLLWFGSLETGYNDINLRGFERDTGLSLGLDPKDPFRANRAYRQLTGRYRDRWIAWRTQRIAAQWGEYAGILRAARRDLSLSVNPYSSIDKTDFPPDTPPEQVDYIAEMREYGADPALLARIPGLRLMYTLSPNLYRWERAHGNTRPESRVYRDFGFSPSVYEPFARLGVPYGIQLHDKYWEDDIGRESLPGLRAWGQPELGWRVSTPVPPAPYALENYAAALGNADVTTLTKGGFVIGTVGIEPQLAPWAVAFAQLPAAPFAEVPGLADPVRVRSCRRADGEWAYAQNRLAVPLELVLSVAGQGKLTDLVTGTELPVADGRATIKLPAYGLVALWSPAGGLRVTGGAVRGTGPVRESLAGRLTALSARLPAAPEAQRAVAAPRLALAQKLVSDGRLARALEVLGEPWEARLAQ